MSSAGAHSGFGGVPPSFGATLDIGWLGGGEDDVGGDAASTPLRQA